MSRTPAPTISLVTPNYNGAEFLRPALDSVLGQGYPALEYVVVDGASTDGTRLIIEPYRSELSAFISEPDTGHCDALNKGFALTTGDIMGWINSDDVLHPGCLARVAAIFEAYPQVEWITGRASAMGISGQIEHVEDVRPWSRLRFLTGDHRWIQQESTFWRRSLWERAGGKLDESLSLANDFELWTRFFRHAPLYSVDQMLGCFRVRPGQRSVDQRTGYEREVDAVLRRELDSLEPGWAKAHGDVLSSTPRALTPAQRAQLDPKLRVYDPPIIQMDDVRQARPIGPGAPRFSAKVLPPEPISDLSAFKDRHRNERCFILGNGPSLNETDLSLLKGETVFACNAAFLLFDRIDWRPDYYACVDSRVLPDRAADIQAMLEAHPDMVAFFPAELQSHGGASTRAATRTLIPEVEGRYFFNETVGDLSQLPWSQFSPDANTHVVQPHTVAISMLQLAAYMGFSEIYLVGCDTRYTVPDDVEREGSGNARDPRLKSTSDDPNHFDTSYFGAGRDWHQPNVDLMTEHYRVARTALEALGVRVKNATVGGDLEVFDRIRLEEVFDSPPAPRQAHAATVSAPGNTAPTKSLTQLRIQKARTLIRNNASALISVGSLGLVMAVLGWALADLRIWLALGFVAVSLGLGLGAVALKTRRILSTLTAQLRSIQNQHARAELALQNSEDELAKLRARGNRGDAHRPDQDHRS